MYGQRDHSLEEMKDITPAMDRQKDYKGKRLQEGWPFEKLHYSTEAEFTRNLGHESWKQSKQMESGGDWICRVRATPVSGLQKSER